MTTRNDAIRVGNTLLLITADIGSFISEEILTLTDSALLLPLGRIFYTAGMVLLAIGGMAGLGLANAEMTVRMHELLAPLMALGRIAADALGLAADSSESSASTSALSGLSAVGISAGLCAATLGGRLWEHALERKLPSIDAVQRTPMASPENRVGIKACAR